MKYLKWLFRIIKDSIISFNPSKIIEFNCFTNNSIVSFNIERDKPEKNDWCIRRENIISFIEDCMPNVLCLQEVMPHQYKYLQNKLKLKYDSYFIDAFTKKSKGLLFSEGLTIFYSSEQYNLIKKGVFKLSNKFGFKTKHWRICQWIKLEDKNSNEILYIFNTHLDHKDRDARKEGFNILLKEIYSIVSEKSKIFICGDFNCEITWPEAKEFTSLFYTRYITNGTIPNRKVCIDYIFTDQPIKQYKCIEKQMSDHFPIMIIY